MGRSWTLWRSALRIGLVLSLLGLTVLSANAPPQWGAGPVGEVRGPASDVVRSSFALGKNFGLPSAAETSVTPDEPSSSSSHSVNLLTEKRFATEPFAAGNMIATKPTMGWNPWNHFGDSVTETLVRQTADAMVSSGLSAAGYDVIALDDGWSASARDASGNLTNDPVAFPTGMKALGDYIHSKGLRFGIYASIGRSTCTGKDPGSLDHEFQDAATFASWGVDYVKADRCDADRLVMKDIYARWRDAIVASGRTIILSASDNSPADEPWAWGPSTAHQWRMSGDISDDWTDPPGQPSWKQGMINIFDRNAAHAAATAPGTFNDPDMLQVGNGGMTETEYRTHFGLWALMSAPLLAGNDVRNMPPSVRDILAHPEVIAIDQDGLSFQAVKANDDGAGLQTWYKPLSGSGARAVGLLNRGNTAATMAVTWTEIGLAPGNATVRDVWARTDRGTFTDGYNVSVGPHGVALLRIVGTDRPVVDGFLSDLPWTYMANEVGPVERDLSNGGQSAGDGRNLTLNGVRYAKGLGAHAPSAVEFRSKGNCSTFAAEVGVDDEAGPRATVIFQVWRDGQLVFDSGVMTEATPGRSVSVNTSGMRSLRLQVVAVDSTIDDHADWANARVICAKEPNQRPRASFTTNTNRVKPGDLVAFDATASTDPDGTIQSYRWEFGDGSSVEGQRVVHSYRDTGKFLVVLTVVDDAGGTDSTTGEIIANVPPTAVFVATPGSSFRRLPIQFDASGSTDVGGRIVSYWWSFGDGTTAPGQIVTHAYVPAGTFPVVLVVEDDFGEMNETVQSVRIVNRPPAIASTSPEATTTLGVSESRTFVVIASDPDGDALSFEWSVGDVSVWSVGDVSVGSSSSSYAFVAPRPGNYNLRVFVSDGSLAVASYWVIDVQQGKASSPSAELPSTSDSVVVATMAVVTAVAVIALIRRRHR